jgi:hypothetical protein
MAAPGRFLPARFKRAHLGKRKFTPDIRSG